MVQSPLEFFNGQAEKYARDNPNLSQETVENVFDMCTKNIGAFCASIESLTRFIASCFGSRDNKTENTRLC